MIRVATDVGGTFTDLVYFEIDEKTKKAKKISNAKSDTTPPNYEQGVFKAIKKSGISISEAIFFAHGTTVIINSITERKGSVTGLITTKGFRDSLEIARGDRPDFFNLRYKKPKPFIPRYLRTEVPGRMDFLGKEIGSEMARTEVSKEINAYIQSHKLQDKANGRIIHPDAKLTKLLKVAKEDELTYFNLQRYMSPHFAKNVKKVVASE